MFPGPGVSMTASPQSGQPLARLAELAEVVSLRQQLPFNMGMARVGNPSPTDGLVQLSIPVRSEDHQHGSVSAVLSKRPSLHDVHVATKRPKMAVGKSSVASTSDDEDDQSEDTNDDLKDVRFREYQAEIWSEKFEDLCEFRRQYGHCHVSHTFTDNAPLAQWVKRQRYQFKLKLEGKRSTLSDERVRLLNQIGFIWNSHDVVWEERWYELLAFKQMHGHCIVPSNYDKNPQLAIWVKVRTNIWAVCVVIGRETDGLSLNFFHSIFPGFIVRSGNAGNSNSGKKTSLRA